MVHAARVRTLIRLNMNYPWAVLLILIEFANNITAYNVDALDIGWNTSVPHLVDGAGRIVHPSRGVFALSGHIDVKEDFNTDAATVEMRVFYSSNGISYLLSPFRAPQMSLTKAFNTIYKDYVMEEMLKCCTNAIEFVDKFVSPVTKRFIECNNCLFPSDNFPSSLRPGYYRIVLVTRKPEILIAVSVLLKVELD